MQGERPYFQINTQKTSCNNLCRTQRVAEGLVRKITTEAMAACSDELALSKGTKKLICFNFNQPFANGVFDQLGEVV